MDRLGGIPRLGKGLCHDDRERVADVFHLVHGQRRIGGHHGIGAVPALEGGDAGNVLDPVAAKVGAREHADDSRRGEGGGNVDRDDVPVGNRRAEDEGMGLAVDAAIVGKGSLAGEKPGILGARHRLADAEFHCVVDGVVGHSGKSFGEVCGGCEPEERAFRPIGRQST